MEDDSEPIADDEVLYRRVPASMGWYSPEMGLDPRAFAPHKTNDATGLSISRKKHKTVEEAARGQPGKSYYVAILRAGDLRKQGIAVEPRSLPGDPGHAEMVGGRAGASGLPGGLRRVGRETETTAASARPRCALHRQRWHVDGGLGLLHGDSYQRGTKRRWQRSRRSTFSGEPTSSREPSST